MGFWRELSRRNVYRVGATYVVASWLIIQVVNNVSEPLILPDSFDTLVVVLLGIGLPIALIFAWAFELTPKGLKRTDSMAMPPQPRFGRQWDFAIIGVLIIAVAYFAFFDEGNVGTDTAAIVTAPSSIADITRDSSDRLNLDESEAEIEAQVALGSFSRIWYMR